MANTSVKEKSTARIDRPSVALGAIVHGIDLSEPLDDETFQQILDLVRDYQVVCFRDQAMTPQMLGELTGKFGEIAIDDSPMMASLYVEGCPGVALTGGVTPTTQYWHTDECYAERPLSLAVMSSKEIAESGNNLMFADQHAAYDLLSDTMKSILEPLRGVNRVQYKTGEVEENIHPIVRTHPVTGRKCLFVSRQYTKGIVGMTDAESRALLDFLCEHCSQPFLTYLHHWRTGDVLIWDNINTQHLVINHPLTDGESYWYRTSVVGEVPA